jgi:hypothetical protein
VSVGLKILCHHHLPYDQQTLLASLTGLQVGMKVLEQLAKEIVIPDLNGSESLKFLKIDYVKYNFSK